MERVFFLLFILAFSLGPITGINNTSINKNSFLISSKKSSKKRPSKNKLKQNIGVSLKHALYRCAEISSELGELQKKISKLQSRLLSSVEKLVGDEKIFRKASRNSLDIADKIMTNVRFTLEKNRSSIKSINLEMDKSSCLKV